MLCYIFSCVHLLLYMDVCDAAVEVSSVSLSSSLLVVSSSSLTGRESVAVLHCIA